MRKMLADELYELVDELIICFSTDTFLRPSLLQLRIKSLRRLHDECNIRRIDDH
jgi:hypothetical protein